MGWPLYVVVEMKNGASYVVHTDDRRSLDSYLSNRVDRACDYTFTVIGNHAFRGEEIQHIYVTRELSEIERGQSATSAELYRQLAAEQEDN